MMIKVGYIYNFYRNKIHLRHVEMCIHLTVLCLNWYSDSWMPRLQTEHPQNQYQEKHECVDLATESNGSNVSSQNI